MRADCWLGLDLGTSGCRALAVDGSGEVIALARAPLPPPERDDSGKSRQDAECWWQAVVQVLSALAKEVGTEYRPRALALDGTSSTLLVADPAGKPLTPALMYDDSSAREQLARIRTVAPPRVPVHSAGSSLAKLLHLRQHHPALFRQDCRALHQADWILGRLSGRFEFSDENNCLKLGYDAENRSWPEWLRKLDLPAGCLPKVLIPGEFVGGIEPGIAQRTGLPTDLRLRAGTTDSTAATIATGIDKPGEAVTTLGSTLVLKVVTERPIHAPEYGVYSQRFGDGWLVGGASNAGAAVCAHYFSPERMAELSTSVDATRDSGLDYYPLLKPGERFPINDPDYPPRLKPRPANDLQFWHGLLEGLSRIEAKGYALLRSLGAPAPTRVLSIGGGAKNPAWRALRARLLGVPVELATQQEAAYGCALLAQRGDSAE